MSNSEIGARYNRIRDAMHSAFPLAICERGGQTRPLKVDVHTDLFSALPETVSQADALFFLRHWTRRAEYLKAVGAGGARYAMDGSEAGSVSTSHIADAERRLSEKKARNLKPRVAS